MNLNQINIIGRVSKLNELKSTPSGVKILSFTVATNRIYQKDGEKKQETEYHNCVAFGKPAEIIGLYVEKGQEMYISGYLKTREWESESNRHYRTEIIVEKFEMGQKTTREKVERAPKKTSFDELSESLTDYPTGEINPDDIPF
jgi:single-strand DNA-binding protein